MSQRSKEEANDYRYFPEPDLPPLKLGRDYVARLQSRLPELPEHRRLRFLELGLSEHEAATLTESRERADYFEAVMAALPIDESRRAKAAANWVLGEVAHWQNAVAGRALSELRASPEQLSELIGLVEAGAVTAAVAKEVFEEMAVTGRSAGEIVDQGGLGAISGDDALTAVVREVIARNEKMVADYRAGKSAAANALMGQVMRETKGRATPQAVLEIITRELT